MKKIVFYCFFPILTMMSGGCTTAIVPVTKKDIKDVGGIDNAKQIQYYISKEITMRLVEQNGSAAVRDGVLVRECKTDREKIVIAEQTEGVLLKRNIRSQLLVAFESHEGDPSLRFGRDARGKYVLIYKNPERRTVQYGGKLYEVSYKGLDAPYLLMKMKDKTKQTSKSRKAKGLKVDK